jgi:hypothetical protein
MDSHTSALRTGVEHGLLLAAANLGYQSLTWFTGLNRFNGPLLVFFAFYPAAIFMALRRLRARPGGARFGACVGAGLATSVVGSAMVVAMMMFFLDVLGHGTLPPALVEQMQALRAQAAAGSAQAAERLAALKRLTPDGFALQAGIGNLVLGAIETLVLAGAFVLGGLIRAEQSEAAAAP